MSSSTKYLLKAFSWSFIAKISDSLIKVVSVSLLLKYFGKENFGLLSLAISANAYMQLLDLGINTGAIKFFSQWIGKNDFALVDKVSRTSISFYGLIGLINTLVLLVLAFWGTALFNVNEDQAVLLRELFLVLSLFSIVNWCSSVFNQLLIADEKIPFIQFINIFKSFANLALIVITISTNIGLINYFLFTTIINSIVVVPYFIKTKQLGLINSFRPAIYFNEFKPILKYSIAIFLMAIFQMTATNSRPIILGIFSSEGVGIVSDYRIMETIAGFVITLGGVFISIFLPKASKLVQENKQTEIEKFAINSTSITSIIVILLCFPLLINTNEIISLYVGSEFNHLSKWLILWLLTILIFMHNSPVASLVLATGKTRMLVYSSAIACIISLIINALLCPIIGVGSAVIGYLVYIIIQMVFYYSYFNSKILFLNSLKIFLNFFYPVLIAVVSFIPIYIINLEKINSLIVIILIKSTIWFCFFTFQLFLWKIIDYKTLKQYFKIQA